MMRKLVEGLRNVATRHRKATLLRVTSSATVVPFSRARGHAVEVNSETKQRTPRNDCLTDPVNFQIMSLLVASLIDVRASHRQRAYERQPRRRRLSQSYSVSNCELFCHCSKYKWTFLSAN